MSSTEYIVQSGDTLYAIGKANGINWRFLGRFNELDNPHQLRVGQRIKIPPLSQEILMVMLEFATWGLKHSHGAVIEVGQELMRLSQDPHITRERLQSWLETVGLTGIDVMLWRLHPYASVLFTIGWFICEYRADLKTYILPSSK